jgi:mRNA-degrading endonuclease toxin of MazEF toxin-antitoxin module
MSLAHGPCAALGGDEPTTAWRRSIGPLVTASWCPNSVLLCKFDQPRNSRVATSRPVLIISGFLFHHRNSVWLIITLLGTQLRLLNGDHPINTGVVRGPRFSKRDSRRGGKHLEWRNDQCRRQLLVSCRSWKTVRCGLWPHTRRFIVMSATKACRARKADRPSDRAPKAPAG